MKRNTRLTRTLKSANITPNKRISVKDDDEDGWNKCFQRVGGWCEPTAGIPNAYHFRVEGLKMIDE